MDRSMDRRSFSSLFAAAGVGVIALKITGCGSAPQDALLTADGDILVYDITMKGWSTLGSGFLGDCGRLKAQAIADRKAVSLPYEQDPHGHKINFTPEHFEKLIKGEKVEILTTEAQGHHHRVVIDPKNKASGNNPGVNAGGNPPPPQGGTPEEKLYANMPESQSNELYVAASADLDESSVAVCVDTAEKCDASTASWISMKRHAPRADKQIFVSTSGLTLDSAKAEQPFVVRAKRKSDQKLMRWLLKLVKNS